MLAAKFASRLNASPATLVIESDGMRMKNHRPGDGSTGPKTPEGRARSSRNAISHGARSETHVILPNESAEEYETLCQGWRNEFAPSNDLESSLLKRLCEREWALRRCDRLYNDAMTKTLLKKPDPSEWSAEDHKYIQLMERYRNSADRVFHAAWKDVVTLHKNRIEAIAREERVLRQIFNNRRLNICPSTSEETTNVEEEEDFQQTERHEQPGEIRPAHPLPD